MESGKAPGMKAKLFSTKGQAQPYILVFAKSDEVMSGLTGIARLHNIKSVYY
jgi:hypothetical protein